MRLERHVGGLSLALKNNYLCTRGWTESPAGWHCERHTALPVPIARALHFQLTEDLCLGLLANGWTVVGFSARGYARLADPLDGKGCSLPGALRKQARREGRKVAELNYSLFLAALVVEPANPT